MSLLIALMSGGLDSTTAAALRRRDGVEVQPLLVSYGQRHSIELCRARRLSKHLGCRKPIEVSIRGLGGSALTDDAIDVPKDRTQEQIGHGVPVTYVPARNLVMLSIAMSVAEREGADGVLIGVNEVDSSGYPDCRPVFIRAFEQCAPLATAAHTEHGKQFTIDAPLLGMSKKDIVILARQLEVPIEHTWSCYDPQGLNQDRPCERCDSCLIRARAISEA